MSATLTQPQVITNTVNTVQVTAVVNNVEESRIEIHYITMLEDGSTYQRDSVIIDGIEKVKAMYAELESSIANGKTFEAASSEMLYAKIQANLQ